MARSKRNGRLIVSRISEESYEKLRRLCFEKRNDMTLISGEILDWYLLKGQSLRERQENGMAMERDIHKEMHRERQENKEWSSKTVEIDEGMPKATNNSGYKKMTQEEDDEMMHAEGLNYALSVGEDLTPKAWEWLDDYNTRKGYPLALRPLKPKS